MRSLFRVWSSCLSDDQVNRVNAIAGSQPAKSATLFSSEESLDAVRACSVRWLRDDWVLDLLWPFVEQANAECFDVAIERRAEMQVAEYDSTFGGHYGWHHDVEWNGQGGRDRKLSVTVQLSGSADYEGGDFEFEEVVSSADFRSKGTVLVFPSYLRHTIHPVTAGSRRALIAWFSGPQWR